ncbi:hypothetical protein B5G37_01420 [Pseudoflavonifractor sp. An85]|nr:hypothetical protein B5G37_01420 [Pseudoflavonifractor sp. An85]
MTDCTAVVKIVLCIFAFFVKLTDFLFQFSALCTFFHFRIDNFLCKVLLLSQQRGAESME